MFIHTVGDYQKIALLLRAARRLLLDADKVYDTPHTQFSDEISEINERIYKLSEETEQNFLNDYPEQESDIFHGTIDEYFNVECNEDSIHMKLVKYSDSDL